MEQYPVLRYVHGRRNSKEENKEMAVELEIYYNGKRKWISTGVRVLKKHWRADKKVVGRPDAFELNYKIEKLENSIKTYIMKLMIDDKPFSWSEFDSFLENADSGDSFVSFVENRVAKRKDIKESTRRNHKKFYVALKAFGKIQRFSDVTKQNIAKYDEWLHSRKDYTQSTIASYHKYMKVYINDAIRLELLERSPYEGFKVNQGKPRQRKYLEPMEVQAIENSYMPTESLERVRDLFVFQCNTGLAYSDMRKFDFGTVVKKDNRYVIHDVRQKTGEDFYIVLLPKALEVLRKYDFKLPIITNEQYNLRLKLVAMYAGITKNLTSHMGRHTYATTCLNSGIPIEVLAHMIGHADIRTTQIYAKLVNTTVESAYDVLEEQDNIKSFVEFMCDVTVTMSLIIKQYSNTEI